MSEDINEKIKGVERKVINAVSEYAELGGMSVDVGLPNDRIHEPSGLPLSQVGAIHEFGLNEIPERSFLRSVILNKGKEIKDAMQIQAEKASKGADPALLMEQFSLFGQGIVQENMVELSDPPLKRKRKDGSDNPLVHTGSLRQGIIGVVVVD